MENSRNEINLIDLIIKIYLTLIKYKYIFFTITILGILYPFIVGKYLLKEYESSMILSIKPDNEIKYAYYFETEKVKQSTNHLEIVDNMITSINQQIISKNKIELSRALGIDRAQVGKLKSISGAFKQDEKMEPINIYKVTVVVKDTLGLKKFGSAIKRYINENEYIKKQRLSDSIFLTSLLQKTEVKIKELDSVQKLAIKNNSMSYVLTGFENKSYVTESIQLTSLKEKTILELNHLNKVEIVENFYLPEMVKKSMLKELAISIFVSLFISFIIIGLLVLRQKAKHYEKSIN